MESSPTSGHPETASGPAGDSVQALEQQLVRAQAELAEYQAMLDELPAIYETKFRHQLQALAQDIRRLMDERRALQEQLAANLPGSEDIPALLPAATELSAAPSSPLPPSSLRFKRWRRSLHRRWASLCTSSRQLSSRFSASRLSTSRFRRFPLLVLATVLGVALLVVMADLGRRRLQSSTPSQRPTPPSPLKPPRSILRADQDLLLRARGESWVEVENLEGEIVYTNLLQEGEQQRIRLRDGLKVRSGRPDLVDVAVGEGPFEALNPISNLDWKTFLPSPIPSSNEDSANPN